MTRKLIVLAALVTLGCGWKIPPCILDGSCLPKPSPTPTASPVSSPSPTTPPSASPSPAPSASPSPVASPSPAPSPSPSASPAPFPSPSPVPACPRPDDATAAPNRPVPKEPGFRNTFDWSPWFEGKKITAESGCTQYLVETYGEFDAVIIENGHRSGFEHQGCSLEDVQRGTPDCKRPRWEDFYLGVDATNSDSGWDHDTYLGAGRRDYCVSYKHLSHYTCTPCTMTTEGKVTDCGARYELAK